MGIPPQSASAPAPRQRARGGSRSALRARTPDPRPRILLHHAHPALRASVEEAAEERFFCRRVADWETLREEARTAPPTTLAVVDPYAGGEDGLSPHLPALLRESPGVAVVAAVRLGPGSGEELRTLAAWGVSEVVAVGTMDTPAALRLALAAARARPLHRLVHRALPPHLSGSARRILLAAAEAVAVGGGAPELAEALGVSESTVLRRCQDTRLPPPRRLLAWVRALLAAVLLDDPHRPVQGIAYACGYSAESGLRGNLRELMALSATELRRRGAFSTAAHALRRELFGEV